VLDYLIEDAGTEALCVYVEGLLDGMRFRRSAAAARKAGKPLLVVKTGRTQAGVVSARSHTASLAGSFEVFAAVCREEGAVIAHDPDDMVRAAHFLVRHRRPRRGGVAILSTSGGGAGIACDRVSELGLSQAVLSHETRASLGELLLPPQADNPVDLGGRRAPENLEISGEIARLLFDDPNVAYGLAILTSMPFFAKRTKLIGEAAQVVDKPVMIVFTPGAAADAPREAMREIGQFYFDRPEDALRVLVLIAEHDALKAAPFPTATRPTGLPRPDAGGAGVLAAGEATRLLRVYGIPVARAAMAPTPEAAAEAAASIGFPVVLKAVSRDIAHKSDVGAVRLGLTSPAEVAAAARDMAAALFPSAGGARLEGFVVQETVTGIAEVIVGARGDPQLGPVVLVGLGGIAVEILRDIALAPAPVSAERARVMLGSLAAAPLFTGARGRPPLDVDAVADVVSRISWLAADLGPRLVDFEVNPLIVRGRGEGAVAVDSRGTLSDTTNKEPHS
jgi:acetyl-CoA synthetase (ADP-forming)